MVFEAGRCVSINGKKKMSPQVPERKPTLSRPNLAPCPPTNLALTIRPLRVLLSCHQAIIREANLIGGRNGIGIKHALENRIIGTKSRGVYEAPGMEVLGEGLRYVYQAVLDRRATKLFEHLSALISDQVCVCYRTVLPSPDPAEPDLTLPNLT